MMGSGLVIGGRFVEGIIISGGSREGRSSAGSWAGGDLWWAESWWGESWWGESSGADSHRTQPTSAYSYVSVLSVSFNLISTYIPLSPLFILSCVLLLSPSPSPSQRLVAAEQRLPPVAFITSNCV